MLRGETRDSTGAWLPRRGFTQHLLSILGVELGGLVHTLTHGLALAEWTFAEMEMLRYLHGPISTGLQRCDIEARVTRKAPHLGPLVSIPPKVAFLGPGKLNFPLVFL